MQTAISKYAVAAHLAVLAVAPLFLFPFFPQSTVATAWLWLSLFAFVWVVMEPSRRAEETMFEARRRVLISLIKDPLFWFLFLAIGFTASRALNVGIGMDFDGEAGVWVQKSAESDIFPGSVEGTGYLPFAASVAALAIISGIRHSLGKAARAAFSLAAGFLSGVAAIAASLAVVMGDGVAHKLAACAITDAAFLGAAFGIGLLLAVVGYAAAYERGWTRAEAFGVVAIGGGMIGLFVFSPLLTLTVYLGLAVVLWFPSVIFASSEMDRSAKMRMAAGVLVMLLMPAAFIMVFGNNPLIHAKIANVPELAFFPQDYFETRDLLSSIALKAWKAHPWLGTGLGSFALDIRFNALAEDWATIQATQATTLSAWWQLMAERGILGALFIAIPTAFLVWTWSAGLVRSFLKSSFSPAHLLAPMTAGGLIALAFFDCSFLMPETLVMAGATVALSGSSFHVKTKKEPVKKESGDNG